MVSKIMPTLIFPLCLGCTKIRDAYPLHVRSYFDTSITVKEIFRTLENSQTKVFTPPLFMIKYSIKKYLDISHSAFSPLPNVRIKSKEQALDLRTSRAQLLHTFKL